jgi:hypothetical protein
MPLVGTSFNLHRPMPSGSSFIHLFAVFQSFALQAVFHPISLDGRFV